MQLIANVEQINFTEPDCPWVIESTQENLNMLKRTGLAVCHKNQKDGKVVSGDWKIINKHLLYNKDTKKRFVMKSNTFSPTKDIELDISTSINELLWYKYAEKLNIANYYLPIKLVHIYTESLKGMKPGKKLCSYTELLEDYKNIQVWKAFEPDVYNSILAKGMNVPIAVRIFAALSGTLLKTNDILLNKDGDMLFIDNADADPSNVRKNYEEKIIGYINSKKKGTDEPLYTLEEKKDILNIVLSMADNLIVEKDNIIEEMYAIYNRVNLVRHPAKVATSSTPAKEARDAGLALYAKYWEEIVDDVESRLKELESNNSLPTALSSDIEEAVKQIEAIEEDSIQSQQQESLEDADIVASV
jgi:hypothetical protein